MKELFGKVLGAVFLTAFGLLGSVFIVIKVLITCLRKGYRKVFTWKDRITEPPPSSYKAWDHESRHSPEVSNKLWNHAFVTLPESGIRIHYVHSGKVPSDLVISDIDGETVRLSDDARTERSKLLLCIHGYPENWFSWRYILRYFDEPDAELEDYFVVAIDCRGYGDSDKPSNYKAYHVNNLVNDVRGIAQALGYEKFTLAGHDLGGGIGWNVAKLYPEILEKLIILNCPEEEAYKETARRKPSQLLKSWYMFFFQIPFLPELMVRLGDYKMIENAFNGKYAGMINSENRLTEDEVEVFKYSLRHSISAPINYYRAAMWPFAWPGPPLKYPRSRVAHGKPLHTVPILVLWGTGDPVLDVDCLGSLEKIINPANGSKVIRVEGASHWVQQDAPDETIKHMVEFMK